jgi:hypothetical protein
LLLFSVAFQLEGAGIFPAPFYFQNFKTDSPPYSRANAFFCKVDESLKK